MNVMLLRIMMTRSPLHSQEAPDSSNQQVDDDQVIIVNQSIFAAEGILKKRRRQEAQCNIRSNGSAIPKISRPGNRRIIFWINVLSNILSTAKSEISENLVHSMFELRFTIFFVLMPILCQLSQIISINR